MSAENIPYKVLKEIEIVLKYKGLEQTDPVYFRELLDCGKKQLFEGKIILLGWDDRKASLAKSYDLITGDKPEFHRVSAKFPYEDFKAHFIPVPNRPLVKIPFDGKINELADLLFCLDSREYIQLQQNNMRKHVQSHFLINGKEIKNRSLSNALKVVANSSANHTWVNNFIRRIQ